MIRMLFLSLLLVGCSKEEIVPEKELIYEFSMASFNVSYTSNYRGGISKSTCLIINDSIILKFYRKVDTSEFYTIKGRILKTPDSISDYIFTFTDKNGTKGENYPARGNVLIVNGYINGIGESKYSSFRFENAK